MADSAFYWVRNKKTGDVSRVAALPYMGQNSDYEQVDDPRKAHKSKLPPADGDELGTGVTDAENSS